MAELDDIEDSMGTGGGGLYTSSYEDNERSFRSGSESAHSRGRGEAFLITGIQSRRRPSSRVQVGETVVQRKESGFLESGVVQHRRCCGGQRSLRWLACALTLGRPGPWGVRCTCSMVTYGMIFVLLAMPVLGTVAYVRWSGGAFLGAFSIFAIPPLVYIHMVWYARAGHLAKLFDEVVLYGPRYSRQAERVVRRHLAGMAVAVPVAAVIMSVMFFASNPLERVANRSPLAILGMAAVPFFIVSIWVLAIPIVFAGSFSMTWALMRIIIERYASTIEGHRRSVNDALTMHITLLEKIDEHIAHWRAGYTATTVLSVSGIFLIFWSITNSDSFISSEMIPFALWLLVLACALQFYFFHVVSRMSRACRGLRDVLLKYEMALPSDSVERLLVAIHSTTHRARFVIFGFTGNIVVDAVLGILFAGTLLLLDSLVG
ncbi:uncharacterized protein AMSG_08844 [Thecamonas trahens ATCC 50062]|uniref:Uncharacterized protein n=1 Tax=Thecamonas trahens ATCC 50062 TaxID=461836 RepID=A0A0L0DPJ2_THETB|nr:hypothetical protein AMSG_08844 [Thecamonas trahens ATCC 50062]KNC53343.1 hypothetical protein AMSG_08844 [Thecamonas trahens ATCC 50062]|eukprot:XP_013754391.1 hypothetical protein AMSG_08844 [Thecamonas trahens ATCC 50062]